MLKIILTYTSALLFVLFLMWFVVTQPVWVTDKLPPSAQPDVNPETLRSHVLMLSEELPGRVGMERSCRQRSTGWNNNSRNTGRYSFRPIQRSSSNSIT